MTPDEWYFSSPERQAKLIAEARSWLGTPMRCATMVKGGRGGVDCVSLLAAVMTAVGVEHDFRPPQYTLDWGKHNDDSLLVDYLRAQRVLVELPVRQIMPGDIVTFLIGRCEHHAGIVIEPPYFVHAVGRLGVTETALAGRWLDKARRIFRVAALNPQPSTD